MSSQQPDPQLSLRGAVDLSSLGQSAPAAADVEAPPGVIREVTTASFEQDVLQLSLTVPVIVDLWATWCQPCKQLSPILERLAAEYAGRFALATVDVDAEPELAAAFQVQSIPSVIAIVRGQPIPLFQGALPESQVRPVIEQVLKVAAENGVSGNVADAPEPTEGAAEGLLDAQPQEPEFVPDEDLDAAADAIDAGDWAGAEAAYRAKLAKEPANEDALAGLVMVQVQGRIAGADVHAALAAADANPSDVQAQILAADLAFQDGGATDAFDRIIAAIRATSGDDRETLRLHLVDLFRLLGDADPRVGRARNDLASALY